MKVTIEKKTDQLNYEDFLGGVTRIVTITGVKRGTKEQQYDIEIEGDHRVWRPAVTVLKLLVQAWGDDASLWVGRQAMLYGDPDIMFGPDKVGGIRVSHLSHIAKPVSASLTKTRGKRTVHTVQPLPQTLAAPPPADDRLTRMSAGMTARGMTEREERLAYVVEVIGREIAAPTDMTGDEMDRVLAALAEPIGGEE